jgi:hypothetical protein
MENKTTHHFAYCYLELQKHAEARKTLLQLVNSYSLAIHKVNENRDAAISGLGTR